ncbi:MAG: outer membrane beta-barrel protein [Rickettsiella sp.]|nr:outer membrane beta-barrel protein [Rickettsiella sp.]
MCKKIGLKTLFIFFCSFPVLSNASIPGFYILGQIGSGNTHAEASDAAALSIDNKIVFTGRIAGGYQFNQNLAVEIGYIRFSNVDFSGVGGVLGQNVSLSEKAIDFMAKPMLPLSTNFDIYAKLGLAYFKAKGSIIVNRTPYLGYSDSWVPALGLGLSYDITPNVLLDLAWTRLQSVGGSRAIPSADFYSVGVAYYFG